MNTSIKLFAVAVLLSFLSGCAHHHHFPFSPYPYGGGSSRYYDPHYNSDDDDHESYDSRHGQNKSYYSYKNHGSNKYPYGKDNGHHKHHH